MLQAAEASVGLSLEYYDPLISGNRHKHNHLQSQARAVRIVRKTIGYQDCEEHALCVAMHTYMGLLLKIAGPHFQWDEANRMPLATELGQRLLHRHKRRLQAESRRSTLLCPMAAFTQDRSFTPTGGTGDVRSRTEQDAAFQKEGAALAAVTSLTASP